MAQGFFILVTALSLAGCSSYQGGAGEQTNTMTGGAAGEGNPQPANSPTFRPGMNPEDPRDSHFTIRPQPNQPPGNTMP